MASPKRGENAPSPVVVASRCSFETTAAFREAERELQARRSDQTAHDIRRKPTKFQPPPASRVAAPVFVATAKSPSKFSLKTEAARSNDHAHSSYTSPSAFQHREDSPAALWRRPGEDFVAKFHVSSNQDLRRRTALDQEGFFAEEADSPRTQQGSRGRASGATQFVDSDRPGFRSPPRSASRSRAATASPPRPFRSSVPHTAHRSSSVELRLETIVDQNGLLPHLREIRDHRYRDEASKTPDTVPFRAAFKPAPSLWPIGDSRSSRV